MLAGFLGGILYYAVFPFPFLIFGFQKYAIPLAIFLLSLLLYSAPLVATGLTVCELSSSISHRIRRLFHLLYLGAIVFIFLPSNTKAALEGLLVKPLYFHRTPKIGQIGRAPDLA
jgi:hypothetical protein